MHHVQNKLYQPSIEYQANPTGEPSFFFLFVLLFFLWGGGTQVVAYGCNLSCCATLVGWVAWVLGVADTCTICRKQPLRTKH